MDKPDEHEYTSSIWMQTDVGPTREAKKRSWIAREMHKSEARSRVSRNTVGSSRHHARRFSSVERSRAKERKSKNARRDERVRTKKKSEVRGNNEKMENRSITKEEKKTVSRETKGVRD